MSRYAEAEKAIVATLITRPDTVAGVSGKLKPEDFSTQLYRDGYSAILQADEEGKVADIITLRSLGISLPLGFLDILGDVTDLDTLIETVKEGGYRARVSERAENVIHAARTKTMSELEERIEALGEMSVVEHPTMFDHSRTIQHYRESLARRNTVGTGLPWGWQDMDDMLQPAVGGDMIVVCARPSVGKTALAENIADNFSFEAAFPVLFISAEMRLSQLMDRAISRITDIPAQRLLRGRLGPTDEEKVKDALAAREAFNIFYVDDGRATTTSIRAAARKVRQQYGGLTAIVVDYIQLLADPGDQEYQRVTKISRALKGIAREFDVPMLALSQLSRAGQYRKDNRPRLEDIRDSGAIEQDADLVFGLYAPSNDELECIVLKNRQGSIGTIMFTFDKDHVRITDAQ